MITTMYDTATIFRREFVARRPLLWAAAYIAVLIAVVPLAPFISALERTDVRDLMSVGSVLGAALALSIAQVILEEIGLDRVVKLDMSRVPSEKQRHEQQDGADQNPVTDYKCEESALHGVPSSGFRACMGLPPASQAERRRAPIKGEYRKKYTAKKNRA